MCAVVCTHTCSMYLCLVWKLLSAPLRDLRLHISLRVSWLHSLCMLMLCAWTNRLLYPPQVWPVTFTKHKEDKYVTTVALNLNYIMLYLHSGLRSIRRVRMRNYSILIEHTLLGMFLFGLNGCYKDKQPLWQFSLLQKLNCVCVGLVLLTHSQECWLLSFAFLATN